MFADRDYSVCEYGKRMTRSYGLLTLGQDPGNGYEASAPMPNNFIYGITRAVAYETALAVGLQVLAQAPLVDQPGPSSTRRRIVDLVAWSDLVLCELVEHWFGFPDPSVMQEGGHRRDVGPPSVLSGRLPRRVRLHLRGAAHGRAIASRGGAWGSSSRSAGAAFTNARRAALRNGAPPNPTLIDTLLSGGYMEGDEDATSRAWIGAVSGFTRADGR